MFRTCVNTLKIARNNLNNSRFTLLKRHAGHSKWQNIKHIKAAEDAAKASIIVKLSSRIRLAVRQGGANPENNRTLKGLIAEGKKSNIPKETIERIISKASGQNSKASPICVRGPKNIIFVLDAYSSAPQALKNQVQAIGKKFNFMVDAVNGHESEFKHIGVVKCKPLKAGEDALDKALEHAIEVDAEEVTEDENKNLVFQCHVNRVEQIRERLEAIGYEVTFADVEVDFSVHSNLNDAEIELCQKFLVKLDDFTDIVKVSDNIA